MISLHLPFHSISPRGGGQSGGGECLVDNLESRLLCLPQLHHHDLHHDVRHIVTDLLQVWTGVLLSDCETMNGEEEMPVILLLGSALSISFE